MAHSRSHYTLPNSSSTRCLDRFSILDDDAASEDEYGNVWFWPLLEAVLEQPVTSSSQLIDVLDTIANLLRGTSGVAGDFGTLAEAVTRRGTTFFTHVWPRIVKLALRMPLYFPLGSIKILSPGDEVHLSTGEAACLVAHQFLCTLQCPSWRDGYYDFSIWYASEQRHPRAIEMYFEALFAYFEHLDDPDDFLSDGSEEAKGVTYSLHAYDSMPKSADSRNDTLTPLSVISVENYSTEQQELAYQGPYGGVVVSANKYIGFGQSATQEELFVGNCPEACPAVLLTPVLGDDEVLVVRGAAPMLRITGQRRNIDWEPLSPGQRRGGRMLFMDALEIDEAEDGETLPDLRPESLKREINKAYTAFSSWSGENPVIWTGVWGCGAFNGDPAIKMTLLWIAATVAGKELRIICDPLHGGFPGKLREFSERAVRGSWKVRDLEDALRKIPRDVQRLETIGHLVKQTET